MIGGHTRKEIGSIGESIACQFLEQKGFCVIERNFLRPWGEIDIIVVKDDVVRFVEVKAVSREILPNISRENNDYRPEERVDEYKLRKVARTAEMYMNSKGDTREYQIDVIGVYLNMTTRQARCRHYEQVL